jgi:hypothetical protein
LHELLRLGLNLFLDIIVENQSAILK